MDKKIVLMLIPLLLLSAISISIRLTSAQPQTLKIGLIGPVNLKQWHANLGGMQGGAHLAAMEINATGGINIGGTTYYIKIVEADEHAYPLDETAAQAEIQRLLYTEGCKFIVGGFRTEVTDVIVDETVAYNLANPGNEAFLFINGASTDWLIRNLTDPTNDKYKWIFRINPINSTMLFKNMLGYLQGYLIPYKLALMYGGNVNYAVFVEDLEWTQGIIDYLQYIGLGPNATFVYGAETPPGTTDFTTYLSGAEAANARLLVIAYTLPDTIYLLSQWRARESPMLVVGIDVWGQSGFYPSETGGTCEYEVQMDFAGTRTPIIPGITEKFWDNFVGNFSAWPIYTAWGAYNALYALKNVLEDADTLDPTTLLPYFEAYQDTTINGVFKYTAWHDVFSLSYGPIWPDGYTRAMMVQWIVNATGDFVKEVVCPIDQEYSRKTLIPPWIYELAPWDTNYDGTIDLKDVLAVALAFGAFPGHPRWNIELDINADGKVDLKDYFGIVTNYGRTVPWPLP